MSSANFFTGYSNDKPSSKVLNPPGGRSNNIFGSVEENTASNASNKSKNQTSSIFFGDDSTPSQMQQQHHGQYNNGQVNRQKSNVFGEDPAKENNRDNRRGYNPITGKAYEDPSAAASVATTAAVPAPVVQAEVSRPVEQQQQQQQQEEPQQKQLHTSSRVLQPPGGKSHGLW
jgi:hypothetical protein